MYEWKYFTFYIKSIIERVPSLTVKDSKHVLECTYNFIKKLLKFMFHNANYISLISVEHRESDSTKITKEIV